MIYIPFLKKSMKEKLYVFLMYRSNLAAVLFVAYSLRCSHWSKLEDETLKLNIIKDWYSFCCWEGLSLGSTALHWRMLKGSRNGSFGRKALGKVGFSYCLLVGRQIMWMILTLCLGVEVIYCVWATLCVLKQQKLIGRRKDKFEK